MQKEPGSEDFVRTLWRNFLEIKTKAVLVTILAISLITLAVAMAYRVDMNTYMESLSSGCWGYTHNHSLIIMFASSTTDQEKHDVFARLGVVPPDQSKDDYYLETYDAQTVPEIRQLPFVQSLKHGIDSPLCSD